MLATIKRLRVPLIAMTGDEICGPPQNPSIVIGGSGHGFSRAHGPEDSVASRSGRASEGRPRHKVKGSGQECPLHTGNFDTSNLDFGGGGGCGAGLLDCAGGLCAGAGSDGFDDDHAGAGGCAGGDFERAARVQGRGLCQLASGGKLGKRLARVESLMHTGEALPRVSPQTKMPDVIYEMSRKKLGVTAVVEGERLVGIISDGDLRRLLEKRGKDVMDLTAGEAMTRNPKTIAGGRVCGDGAGFDGREEDHVADGGGWEWEAGGDRASARSVDHGTGLN